MVGVDARAHTLPAPSGWVPVDRRWWGLDRRSIAPAVVVLSLAVVMIVVIPAVDAAVPSGRTLPAGAKIGLSGDVELTPATGWTVEDGAVLGDTTRAGSYPPTARVVRGATELSVTTGRYAGTAGQLLTQIESSTERAGGSSTFVGDPRTVRTTGGLAGVQTATRTATTAGLLATFVVSGYGVQVSVVSPRQPSRTTAADVDAMVSSLAPIGSR